MEFFVEGMDLTSGQGMRHVPSNAFEAPMFRASWAQIVFLRMHDPAPAQHYMRVSTDTP